MTKLSDYSRSSRPTSRRNLVTSTKDLVYNRVRTVETSFFFSFFAAFDKVEARRVLERGGAFTWHGPGTNAVIPGPMIRSQELSVTNVQSAASTTEIARSEVTVTLITSFQFVSGAQPRYVTGIRPFCRAKN